MRRLAACLMVLLMSCGTSEHLQGLGDQFGCTDVEETGKVDMHGTGLAAFCDGLPGGSAFLFWFRTSEDRDRFFNEVWRGTKFAGSFVLAGDDWAVASDADTISEAAALKRRVGGQTLSQLGLGP